MANGIGTKIYKENIDWDKYADEANWCNSNGTATIEDKGEYYEVVENAKPTQEELNAAEVARLKMELADTDYKCLKYVDGALTEEEYAEVRSYRQELRRKINELGG